MADRPPVILHVPMPAARLQGRRGFGIGPKAHEQGIEDEEGDAGDAVF